MAARCSASYSPRVRDDALKSVARKVALNFSISQSTVKAEARL